MSVMGDAHDGELPGAVLATSMLMGSHRLIVTARGQEEDRPRGCPTAALERVWRELQADLASRAPQGKLPIAERSDHDVPGHQPEIVIEATRQVVLAARGG